MNGKAIGRIGKREVEAARERLRHCRAALAPRRARIAENEAWWQMRGRMPGSFQRDTDGVSGWLFNCVANKHADAMDSYPTLSVLPREPSDEAAAEMLSRVLPVILEQCGFEEVYDRCWLEKLKNGTACYGVFWNQDKRGGEGDVDIRAVSVENLYWEPGIEKLEQSRDLFYVTMMERKEVQARWPLQAREMEQSGEDLCPVVDWYYKKRRPGGNEVHLCKFCGGEVLFASENDPRYARGIYRHGMYPFVLDCLYPLRHSPEGLGMIDRMKGAQMRIDLLQNAITENALECVNNRWFIRDSAGINEEEFGDHSNKLVHVAGEVDDGSVKPIRVEALNGNYLQVLERAILEMKEVSGNRDANTGGSGGVTAASAIAAMQEAGSKLSRDMIRAGYRAFAQVCKLVIEDVRQFYTGERVYRVTGKDGGREYLRFHRGALLGKDCDPVYDIQVRPMKESPYTRISRNDMATQLYRLGLFSPDRAQEALLCLEMMDFEGREEIMRRIRAQRGTGRAPESIPAPERMDPGPGLVETERERIRSLHEI